MKRNLVDAYCALADKYMFSRPHDQCADARTGSERK